MAEEHGKRIQLYVPAADLEHIDQAAAAAGENRSEYMVKAARRRLVADAGPASGLEAVAEMATTIRQLVERVTSSSGRAVVYGQKFDGDLDRFAVRCFECGQASGFPESVMRADDVERRCFNCFAALRE